MFWVALLLAVCGPLSRIEPLLHLRWWLLSKRQPLGRPRRRFRVSLLGLVVVFITSVRALGQLAPTLAAGIAFVVAAGSLTVVVLAVAMDVPVGAFMLFSTMAAAAAMGEHPSSWPTVSLPMVLVLMYLGARPLVRYWLIPGGRTRQTYWVCYYLTDYWTLDRRPAAILSALSAWQRSGRATADLDWLGRQLQREKEFNATLVLAGGLLQAARGNLDLARQTLQSVVGLAHGYSKPAATCLAAQWLCGEAARRGAWGEVLSSASAGKWMSASLLLYQGVAQAILGQAGPPRWRLQLLARLSYPGLRPLLALARVPQVEHGVEPEASVAVAGDSLPSALVCHVGLIGQRLPDSARLLDLGSAWDQAGTTVETSPLVASAGPQERQGLVAEWRAAVVTELSRLLRDSGVCLTDLGRSTGLLAQAKRRVREDVLRELEERHEAIHRRKEDKQALSPLEEWDEWTQSRGAYERAVAILGRESMPLVWPLWHARFCNYAVWLFNERRERMLAHHVFAWLLDEARLMNDAKATALETKNARVTRSPLVRA